MEKLGRKRLFRGTDYDSGLPVERSDREQEAYHQRGYRMRPDFNLPYASGYFQTEFRRAHETIKRLRRSRNA